MEPEIAANHTGQYICPVCAKETGDTTDSKSDSKTDKTIYEAPLTDDVRKEISKLLDELKAHKLSWPFMKPPPVLSLKKLSAPLKKPTGEFWKFCILAHLA